VVEAAELNYPFLNDYKRLETDINKKATSINKLKTG
jgi:hypothetical protein